MLPSSVSKKSAARIFRGRITGIAINPGEKAIRKTWFLGDEHSQILDLFNFLSFSR